MPVHRRDGRPPTPSESRLYSEAGHTNGGVVKKLAVGLLLVAMGLLVVACGGTAAKDTASPSLSPSPTVLTDADLLAQFFADVKPIRVRYRKLEDKLDHIIWDQAHKYADSSWPPAGRKVWKLTDKYDGIMVDLQLVDTPAFMKPAMKNLLKCLRIERKMYDEIGDWLVNKEGWGEGSANGQRYEKLRADYVDAVDAWRIKAKLEAKRYDAKIPWKWN